MWHIKLPLSKGGSLLRVKVGWDVVAHWPSVSIATIA